MEKENKESKAPSKQIIGLLHNGEENALTARELATSTGLSVRDITLQIARERQAGAVILSSGKGYFLPSSEDEILHFVRTMNSRARNIYLAAQSAKAMLAKVPGQLDIFGEEGKP